MANARAVDARERDMFVEMDEAALRKDPVWRHYLGKMGSQLEFTAPEVAGVLGKYTTDDVYRFADSGEIRGLNVGTGAKRCLRVPRECLKRFLASHMV